VGEHSWQSIKVVTTDAEIDHAIEQAKSLQNEPRVTKVEYRPGAGLDLLILTLSDGRRHLIPREDLQGLQSATKEQIAQVEILGHGTGLHWPSLDLDHSVPDLLRRIYRQQELDGGDRSQRRLGEERGQEKGFQGEWSEGRTPQAFLSFRLGSTTPTFAKGGRMWATRDTVRGIWPVKLTT
jgi:Protein of unknown function (DUF2442)